MSSHIEDSPRKTDCVRALFFLCLALIFSFLSNAALAAGTPEQTVRDVQRAIDAKDADGFDHLVDSKRILGSAADLLLAEANTPNGQLPPMLALMLAAVKDSRALASLRDLIIREAYAFLHYGIVSGHFSGKPDQSVRPGGILAYLFSEVSMGRKELRVAGPSAPDGQERALLPVVLKEYGNGNIYPLLVRLQWHSPNWRIVEIVNLPDLWRQIQAEANAYSTP